MIIKDSVRLDNLCPQMVLAAMVVKDVLSTMKAGQPCVITSGSDSKHSATSLHYSGQALDFRTRHLDSEDQKAQLRDLVRAHLSRDYDVILEATHLHVEWQPRYSGAGQGA